MSSAPVRNRPLLAYASRGFGPHDARFIRLAVDAGFQVKHFRFDGKDLERDAHHYPEFAIPADWLGCGVQLEQPRVDEFVSAFQRACSGISPDVVQAGPLTDVALVALRAGVAPLLATSWASDVLAEAASSAAKSAAVAEVVQGTKTLLVDCMTVRDVAIQHGANSASILVVPWGVDLSKFSFSVKKSDSPRLKIISLRSHEALYDLHTLLDAVALLPRSAVELVVGGGGSLTLELQRYAEKLGIGSEVTWIGEVVESELPQLIEDADVYVSTSPVDGSSVSLLQAMAIGRPAIVTDIASNREWISVGEQGWLFPAGDAQELSYQIEFCLGHRREVLESGERARHRVAQDADWSSGREKIASELLKLAGQ